MTEARNTYRLGLFLITTSAVAWSTAGLFTRMIPLEQWTLLAWRGVFGALGICAAMGFLNPKTWLNEVKSMGKHDWLYAGLGGIAMIFYITSLRFTSVAHVAVIYAIIPFLAAILAWFIMAERPNLSAIFASLAALAGVAFMVGFGQDGSWFGDLLALGMTLLMAIIVVVARRFRSIKTMPAAALSALLSAAACWPFGHPLDVTGNQFVLLALFGLVNSALGLALFTLGAKLLPAIETALIGSLDAPLAPLWVWLAFSETPSHSTLIGGAIVFGAVVAHVVYAAT